jgi:hypothetical protein
MNTSNEMGKDLVAWLYGVIIAKDAAAPARLRALEKLLKGLKCSEPELGKWIIACDYPFLIETLRLNDSIFSEEFPGVQLSAAERKSFADAVESHAESCERCRAKKLADLDWQSTLDSALTENKEALGIAIARAAGKQ